MIEDDGPIAPITIPLDTDGAPDLQLLVRRCGQRYAASLGEAPHAMAVTPTSPRRNGRRGTAPTPSGKSGAAPGSYHRRQERS
jgi:hypothetical protein